MSVCVHFYKCVLIYIYIHTYTLNIHMHIYIYVYMYEASIGMPSEALDPGTRGEEDVSEGESTAVCGGLQAWGKSSA